MDTKLVPIGCHEESYIKAVSLGDPWWFRKYEEKDYPELSEIVSRFMNEIKCVVRPYPTGATGLEKLRYQLYQTFMNLDLPPRVIPIFKLVF